MIKRFRYVSVLCCALVMLSSLLLPAAVGIAATAGSGAVTQGYNGDGSVLPGMVVELRPHSQTTVVPLAASDIRNMLGVVVPVNDASIVLTPQTVSSQQVIVATAGRYRVLVSNQNGPIKANDYLTASALPGIAMKASADQAQIVGRATGGFSSDNAIGTVKLKSSLGKTTTVSVGALPASIQLGPNPLFESSSKLPAFLNKAASTVANREVSPVRVYLSLIVAGAVLFVTGSMFYSGVHSGMVAIGRNPLAKKAIGRGLLQTIIAGLIIFVMGMFAAYLILI